MRLWHEELIPYLPYNQLIGQHRECAALRGNGWGKKHATVDYVFQYEPWRLNLYHFLIMTELEHRGVNLDRRWWNPAYRGKNCSRWTHNDSYFASSEHMPVKPKATIYLEHNRAYLEECLDNLRAKGIELKYQMLEGVS